MDEQSICFAWHFANKPDLINYTYCDTVQECRRSVERQYRISEGEYHILSKQIRIIKENRSELIHEEAIQPHSDVSVSDKQILRRKKTALYVAENGFCQRKRLRDSLIQEGR